MQKIPALCVGALAISAAFHTLPAQAQSVEELVEQVKAMRQQLESQRARIDELERDVRTARAPAPTPVTPITPTLPEAVDLSDPRFAGRAVSSEALGAARGTGNVPLNGAASSPLAAGLAVPPAAASSAQLDALRGTGGQAVAQQPPPQQPLASPIP